METKIVLRQATLLDLPVLKSLFIDSIYKVCKADYTENQLRAWAANTISGDNAAYWETTLSTQTLWLAEVRGQIVGFSALADTVVDLLFVHHDYLRRGIAKQLYQHLEDIARKRNYPFLTAKVSLTALPFFKAMGFEIEQAQTVLRHEEYLRNYKMIKRP